MSQKKIDIPGIGLVTLQKHARSRSLRLSVSVGGEVRVSMPRWTPYAAAAAFATANQSWIEKERGVRRLPLLESGQRVGKQHYLRFEHVFGNTPLTTRVTKNEVIVRVSTSEVVGSANVQRRARTASARALKQEANHLLPPRLHQLALKHDFDYKTVQVKSLKRRWGSCSSDGAIALNLYLMELPWEFIDYVLLHELNHTRHMHHGPKFWQALEALLPNARKVSKQLRTYQPQVGLPESTPVVA